MEERRTWRGRESLRRNDDEGVLDLERTCLVSVSPARCAVVVLGGGNWELGQTCPWPLCIEHALHMHCPSVPSTAIPTPSSALGAECDRAEAGTKQDDAPGWCAAEAATDRTPILPIDSRCAVCVTATKRRCARERLTWRGCESLRRSKEVVVAERKLVPLCLG